MNDFGVEFRHLRRVAKAGVDRGDPSVAVLLFQSYSDEARRSHKFELKRLSAMKSQVMAEIAASHNPTDLARLPNPSKDPPPVWQVGKPRKKDPLEYIKLNSHCQWAVAEIRAIYSATIRAVSQTMKPLDSIRVDISRTIHNPLSFLERFDQARLNRYFNWSWRNRTLKGMDLTGFELICAVVIDGYGLRELARIYLPYVSENAGRKRIQRVFCAVLNDYK